MGRVDRRAIGGEGAEPVRGARCLLALAAALLTSGCDQQQEAAFACPEPGTVYTLSTPLAASAEPRFQTRILILGSAGYDCHLLSEIHGDYWMRAALVDRTSNKAMTAAAEELWPLQVGKATHAHAGGENSQWSIDYRVVAHRKFAARVGTFDAYEIVGTLRSNGKISWTTTTWWAPDLRYTLSYRLERSDGRGNAAWEIAALGADTMARR